jgi:hypothetical protein
MARHHRGRIRTWAETLLGGLLPVLLAASVAALIGSPATHQRLRWTNVGLTAGATFLAIATVLFNIMQTRRTAHAQRPRVASDDEIREDLRVLADSIERYDFQARNLIRGTLMWTPNAGRV